MIQIIKADGAAELALIDNLRTRAAEIGEEINRTAAQMMADVKARGYEAVREYSVKLDGAEPKEFSKEELQAAYDACDPKLISAMEHAAQNIRDYNQHLLCKTVEWTNPDGGKVGRIVRGLTRVGVYVPGGTAAYPSSVLMNAVPAKVAGVKEIVMVTPPTENLNQAVLAAAKIAGVDRVIGVGGVQAVAALMYGAGFIPRVDKLVGPGSAYVAAAKRMAYGTVDIDMVAGPSEILIVADDTANPKFVAADLMSQAEHDKLASPMLLTTSQALAEAVDKEIIRQMSYLERSEIMEQSFANFGAAIVCDTLERCAELADLHRPAPCPAALHPQCRRHLPGSLGAGAFGRLFRRPRSRPAHLGHGSVLLAPVRGQLFEDDQHHGVRPGHPGQHPQRHRGVCGDGASDRSRQCHQSTI